ncbi:MAG: ABC transporter substrate-binding protein, partial [Meiothermus sp.]|uniref:ABC transporter substrate-binding protein n=1 Tax=Meiothermus sp. TaxID=1955249 RepID=UPI00298EFBEA
YDYKDFGVDWPENVLFTTEEVLKKYPGEVRKFVQARYRGFRYALDNPQEAGQILLKYNPNLDIPFELAGLEQIRKIMVTPETQKHGLGYLNVAKLQRMAQQLYAAGLVDSPSIAGLASPIPSGVK